MTDTNFQPPLNQIALSVIDLRRTERWFREGLGFLPAGGNALMMSGPIAAKVQGIPRVASCCWWLVGRNSWFQIEMFQFRRPIAKLMPADFRPCDTGYTRIGVQVKDFDAALSNLATLGSHPLTPPLGEPGKRRACVRNPDGVYVEIMEDDPLDQAIPDERDCPVAVRSVTLSTPDLDESVAYLSAVCGHGPQDIVLHTSEHEALWGLPGANCKRALFRAGDVLVEVVQYLDPVGKPWPEGYRICDQGILNIAFGARNKHEHLQVYARACAFGAQPNCKPFNLPGIGVVYLNDPLGFSVEVLWMEPGIPERDWGFEPLPQKQRPDPDDQQIGTSVHIAAPLEKVWRVLCDQNRMGQWIGFEEVRRTRNGTPDSDGYGSERLMKGKAGTVTEQVTGIEPQQCIRYRVIEGSPFDFHNGEIRVQADDGGTELQWNMRFRSKVPFLGIILRPFMDKMLNKMVHQGLKPFIEQEQ